MPAPLGCPAPAQAPPELLRSRIKGSGCATHIPAEINLLGTGMSACGVFLNEKPIPGLQTAAGKGDAGDAHWQLPGQWGEGGERSHGWGEPLTGRSLLAGGAEMGWGAPRGPGMEQALLQAGDWFLAGTSPA